MKAIDQVEFLIMNHNRKELKTGETLIINKGDLTNLNCARMVKTSIKNYTVKEIKNTIQITKN